MPGIVVAIMSPEPAPGSLDGPGSDPRRKSAWLSGAVLLAGLVLTGALTWGASSIHQHNESRLLHVELQQATSVVTAAIPSIQIPLVSAAELAQATGGGKQSFVRYMTPFVSAKGEFVSASLWDTTSGVPALSTSVGTDPMLEASEETLSSFLERSRNSSPFAVLNLLEGRDPSIAYAATAGPPSRWIVLAEAVLPKNRKLNVTKNSAFSQLNYAIYLGRATTASNLLGASPGALSGGSNSASTTIPFGNSVITMVVTPNSELGGTLLARLSLIVALGGVFLALVAALLTEYLVRRRKQAEWLATENRRMYREQRSIAEVLQHALLPRELPQITGVQTSARYIAGRKGTDVGGDWYDVIVLDDDRFLFVVGDVSGHGVEAATLMARLHFAIRAFASQGDSPVDILAKLGPLLNLERDASFATVLCGVVDVRGHSITLVNAGHPPLLLLNGSQKGFVDTTVFPPVGIGEGTIYRSTTLPVPPGSTVLAYTDGLVERRGEVIDRGFERLQKLSSSVDASLDGLLDKLVVDMRDGAYNDDMAILAVRWNN